jgi:hypothetical protein
MADIIHPGLIHRLRFTPMRDLLRLNISGRLDWKGKIAAADLSQVGCDLILRVVRRSRLWQWEKTTVTDELLAHFADALQAGESVEQIIQKFGDERVAAKLIGRATRRKRSILIRTVAATLWTLAAIVALYAILTAIFLAGRPSIKVDYIRTYNASILQTPPDQRAWPLYRQALLQLQITDPIDDLLDAHPGDSNFKKLVQWISDHESAIVLIRQASQKPRQLIPRSGRRIHILGNMYVHCPRIQRFCKNHSSMAFRSLNCLDVSMPTRESPHHLDNHPAAPTIFSVYSIFSIRCRIRVCCHWLTGPLENAATLSMSWIAFSCSTQ